MSTPSVSLPPSTLAATARTGTGPSWLWIFLGWTALAVLLGIRGWLSAYVRGYSSPWWAHVGEWLVCLYYWAACTPLIARLVERYPLGTEHRLRHGSLLTAAGVVLSTGGLVLDAATALWFAPGNFALGFSERFRLLVLSMAHAEFTIFCIIAGIAHAVTYYRQSRARETEQARLQVLMSRLESHLRQAELEALRMQLNPHFLFNTLNSISVLIDEEPHAAQQVLVRLSELLRKTLYRAGQPEIPLQQELEFLTNYLEIERVRYGDRLQVNMQVEPAALNALVPMFVMQPLVENAVKHGVARKAGTTLVELRARRQGEQLELCVWDDGPGLRAEPGKSGIGLRNTQARLRQLYPEGSSFTLTSSAQQGTAATVVLPFCLASDDSRQ